MNKFEPLENEVWVDAKSFTTDYSGHYIVSNMGRCWSFKSNKFLGSWVNDHWNVCLRNGIKQKENMMIGRLILISFNIPIPKHLQGLPTNKLDCMHLDGDSHNNHLENFQWGSRKENQNEINARKRNSEAHKGKHLSEETKRKMSEAKKGEKNYNYGKHISEEIRRKISEAKRGDKAPWYGKYGKDNPTSKSVIQYSKDGTFIRDWSCTMDVERELGINHSSIVKCLRGKRPSAGGYIWRYKN